MGPVEDGPQRAPPPRGGPAKRTLVATHVERPACCPKYHQAIELIGRRWTGAIVSVLLRRQALRFGEIAEAVPELSDRLLSERMKELERHGVVVRTVRPGRPARVEYELTEMGRELAPAVRELERWARRWLA
jgi:DNA-binding HxlR family transcriptional regulator